MPVLFVSHSSLDNANTRELEAWLIKEGFTDIFVDYRNIAAGDKWREELRASAAACRVVVCLVTANWLKSDECFGEFMAAVYMGRRIIPLFLLPEPQSLEDGAAKRRTKVGAEDQGIKIDHCVIKGALAIDSDQDVAKRLRVGLRAAGALNKVGLDPEAFAIDKDKVPTPFPGLSSFGDDDAYAAIFYGRSREIALALDELRKMRATRDQRPFVILGSSGAGKSSLLKAGVIPRLRRERPAWLPMRTFRPGSDPLFNFADALARTLADFGKAEAPGEIRQRLLTAWSQAERKAADGEQPKLTDAGTAALASALESEGRTLRDAAGCPDATILVSVDQAEEIARSEGKSGDAVADYLRIALATNKSDWLIVATVRTDSFPELQAHHRFQGLEAHPFDLRAMPIYYHDSVVEEPARRYGHDIQQDLLEALMKDIPDADALPLLAFTLQRLWQQFANSGALTKEDYDKLGGLKGLIEDAAERALRGMRPAQDDPLPPGDPPKRISDLGASIFVPKLAQINEQGATIRRVAKLSNFNSEQQDLLRVFDAWRLVVLRGETDGNTVEVAHEALFREWTRLKGWLEPERARLDALRLLQIDAATWNRNDRDAAFLNHRGRRLATAKELTEIEDYKKYLTQVDIDYLAACDSTEKKAKSRARRVAALVGLLFAVVLAGPLAIWNMSWLREQWYWLAFAHPLGSSQERALKAGDVVKECNDCPEMVIVPDGNFLMGSPDNIGDDREHPQHPVTIARPFAIAKFELTFAEWDVCVSYGDCTPDISDRGWGRGRQPAINVSWRDAQIYVAWLRRMTGKNYRLLTEAEWEYAARGGRSTLFSFGNDDKQLDQYAWYEVDPSRQTHPVGEKKPSRYGLYDMHGNVAEWVEDCYREHYRDADPAGAAWTGGNCNRRVVRGGSYEQRARALRSASRDWSNFDEGKPTIGIRIGRSLAP